MGEPEKVGGIVGRQGEQMNGQALWGAVFTHSRPGGHGSEAVQGDTLLTGGHQPLAVGMRVGMHVQSIRRGTV